MTDCTQRTHTKKWNAKGEQDVEKQANREKVEKALNKL